MAEVLVAYFSATGTTGAVAASLADAIEADLYEIKPEVPYTNEDLDWRNEKSRSSVEMKDPASRPAIGGEKIPVKIMRTYKTLFLGFPIWWYKAPTIINTFLESYDLHDTRIVLFATSGSSGFGGSVEGLEDSAPGAQITEGEVLNGFKTKAELFDFAKRFLL